ncbi:Uncharacterised protein [Enterococcus durans]|uniref:Uncharacterized protein n=2 Tax=Enterococcus durans TaxID=53345 RepID=A0A377KQR2_9ENTE|nr:Uncharacterised protein [Enterococcus durans]STQ33066.1 Uncharacterised protein [Enterococcus durans]
MMAYRQLDTRNTWQIKHGMSGTRIYKTWHNIRSRCKNPNASKYENYGGKGITICEEWDSSFENFYEWAMENGYEEGLTIDRIDATGNYEPGNCRWATYKEQNNHLSTNHLITFKGETHNITEWAEIVGLSKKCLSERIRRGWEVERALTTSKIDMSNFGNYMKERKSNGV